MRRMAYILLLSMLLFNNSLLRADELQIGIFRATSDRSLQAISKDLAIVDRNSDNLSGTAENADDADDTISIGGDDHPIGLTPAEEYTREIFDVGDYVVICFTPPVSLHIRMIDVSPGGKESIIFPIDGSVARLVSAGSRFCVGDTNSDTLLQMDSGSGVGRGTVWIIGTATEAQAAHLNPGAFSLSSAGKGSAAPAGSKMVGKNRVEGWIDYEVQ